MKKTGKPTNITAMAYWLMLTVHDAPSIQSSFEELVKTVRDAKTHKLERCGCFLFASLDDINSALRSLASKMRATDEFLIFPVDSCFGCLSKEAQDALSSLEMSSVHIPLLTSGKSL